MATTTFTNATDYGPDDYINSAVNVTGMTVANVTNVRLEIDWNPNGADPFCGGDAETSSCVVTNPAGGTSTVFSSYSKSGANARTDTYDITSSFPGTFNGNWTFTLEDEDMMGCNTVTETRVIVTYTVAANNPSTASLGVEVIGVPYGDSAQTAALGVEVLGDGGATPVGNPAGLGIEVLGNAGSGPANNPSISAFGVEVISSGVGPVDKVDVFTLGIEVLGNTTSSPASSNNVRFGSTTITKAYLGSQQLSKIRLGEQVIEL